MCILLYYYIIILVCRNGDFSILTGWGDDDTRLKKAILKVLSQSECNKRYTVSEFDSKKQTIDENLPQLFQANLLCAAVCK